jgi:hypothetical protein
MGHLVFNEIRLSDIVLPEDKASILNMGDYASGTILQVVPYAFDIKL